MFRALGARLGLDWPGVDAVAVAAGAAQATWDWAADGLDVPSEWCEGTVEDGQRRITTVHAAGVTRELFRTVVHRADEWEPDTVWRTTVDVLRSSERVEFGVVVEGEVSDPGVAPVPLQPPLMELLRHLARLGAWAGTQRVRPGAQAVVGTDGTNRFIESVLCDSERRLPVLLFTAVKEHDGVFTPEGADPSLVARELCGLAHVYLMPRVEDTHKLTKRLGMLSAYDGAIRIYWPGFHLDDRPPRHPLHLRGRLTTSTVVSIIRRLVEASARAYRFPPGTETLLALRWRRQERRRLEETLATESDMSGRVQLLSRELDHAIDENVRLAQEVETLRDELERSQRRIREFGMDCNGPGEAPWHEGAVEAMRSAITSSGTPASS